jgi:uncharacterized membrane protein
VEADHAARIDRLERRVADLEAEVAHLRQERPVDTAWSPPQTVTGPDPRWAAPAPASSVASPAAVPVIRNELDVERVLRWGGVGLVVLAIAFAVSTAVSRGWIGRELQLAGALAVSFGLCAAGVWLRERRPPWQHALCIAGVLGAHLTVASPLLRDLAPDWVAGVATVLVAVAGVALAVHVDSRWVGGAVAVAAPAGWFASFGGDPSPLPTVLWVGAVAGGVLAVAVPRRWYDVRVVALAAATGFLLYPSGEAEGVPASVVAAIVGLSVAAAWCTLPSVGEHISGWRQGEIQSAMLVAPWATVMVGLIGELDDDVEGGAVALAVAAVVGAVAWFGRPVTGATRRLLDAHAVSLAVSASLALSIAIGLLLGESTYALGFALQGAGLLLLERRLRPNLRILINGVAVLALSMLLLGGRLIDAWSDDASPGADVAHTLALVAIVVAAVVEERRELRRVLAVGSLVLVLTWLGSILVHLPQGQAIVSVSWVGVGTALLVGGPVRKIPEAAQAGLVVLGLTVAKLLTVDLSEVDTLWRAGLFLLIGLGFLRLALLLPKLIGGGPADQHDDPHDDQPDELDARR